jgi:hypothetical protein
MVIAAITSTFTMKRIDRGTMKFSHLVKPVDFTSVQRLLAGMG